MPFLLSLIKNPKILMGGAVIVIMISLFTWGKIQSSRLESAKADLVIAEQNITVLEESVEAERKKAAQRELDAKAKQGTIDSLNAEKKQLTEEFAETKGELQHILDVVIPGIETPEDLAQAKETVEQAVTASYGCIEAATGDKPCAQ